MIAFLYSRGPATILSPLKNTSPPVALYSLIIVRPVVVLPQPDSPTIPSVSPGYTLKDTSSTSANCGVCYNYTTNSTGGGINNKGGTVKIANGKISYNLSKKEGGGINNEGTRFDEINYSIFEMTGGHIDWNASSSTGGGIYNNSYADFEMTGGSISRNQIVNSSSVIGSGIYSNRIHSFKIGGSAQIPPNTESSSSSSEDNSVYFLHNNKAASANSCINVISELTAEGVVAYFNGNFEDDFYVLKAESGVSLPNAIQKFRLIGPAGYFINTEGLAKSGQLTAAKMTVSGENPPYKVVEFLSSVPAGQSVTFSSEETLNPSLGGGGTITIQGNVTFDAPNLTLDSPSSTLIKVENGGILTLKSGTFKDGYGNSGASIIEIEDGGTLILDGATIQNGSSTAVAGVRMSGGKFIMKSGVIDNCCDRALNVTDGEVTITGGTIQNCSRGGGIKLAGGSGTIKNLTVTENTTYGSDGNGAGIYISGGEYTFEECSIKNNSTASNYSGGGIYIIGGTVTFKSCDITGNKVSKFTDMTNYGGGLAAMSGTVNFDSSNTISGNGHTDSAANNYICYGLQYYAKSGVKWNGTILSSDKVQD